MKKLLYITASTKPEDVSVSKRAGREFIDRLLNATPDYTVEELDIATADIPEPNHRFFKGRVDLVSGPEYDALPEADKDAVDRMNELCTQFLAADVYVIATPMWSMSFPSRLKQYVDCIMLNNRVIRLTDEKAEGLLCDKCRKMVYIQSSGGVYPKIIDFKFNFGVHYFQDVFKALGMKKFYKILVQGTDMASIGPEKALAEAQEDFDEVLEKVCADSFIPQIVRG
jgi:FMN-dependent NADH-azoreductase